MAATLSLCLLLPCCNHDDSEQSQWTLTTQECGQSIRSPASLMILGIRHPNSIYDNGIVSEALLYLSHSMVRDKYSDGMCHVSYEM